MIIMDMFVVIKEYPVELLHNMGEAYSDDEAKIVGVGRVVYPPVPQLKRRTKTNQDSLC